MAVLRPLLVMLGLLLAWQLFVWATAIPPYLLPGPLLVLETAVARWPVLLRNAGVTLGEILLGLACGLLLGAGSALALSALAPLRRWLLPVLVVSQAIPVFALAPLLVLWFGYGLWSKVAMATLIIYFPVTAAFYDGLRRCDPGWLDLARSMDAKPWRSFLHIRIPAALPAFFSGLRVATAVAPIGAVVGEWVGSSAGLGHLMLNANARLQVDLVFAALLVLALIAVALYFAVDRLGRHLTAWQPEG
ncbi:putative hydroxymethylpyrimidine transport system permease protein [Tistlia consotensis]|uniref:Putative hydroxymethylpyrimidine transport system permease protein n=1 Tax=Tistlia consotensis USBA 355 TaxID=560819 RepID=A0A1Y6CUE5_9PROT|nr:ABC transporter permease subunit [Tistlia consotensis]SMF77801.1 putative hydroxymethylpyrimidine transport system permease protein [Tistlia consotensis USBA 355]SNS20505.1 putative hydroxymethylpyrimidine transport system permease protein [Tistlia consotensis]